MNEPGPVRSNLDLVNEADESVTMQGVYDDITKLFSSFPIPQIDLEGWLAARRLYYHLRVDGVQRPVGLVHPTVVEALRASPGWRTDELSELRTVTVVGDDEPTRSQIVAETFAKLREAGQFEILSRWRGEVKPVYGTRNDVLFSVERAAVPMLGIVQYGIHLSVYTREAGKAYPSLWISKRSATTANYSGFLDNTVSGGYRTGEAPLETVVREAAEEASLPAELVRGARACGTVAYFHHIDRHVVGEKYLVQPEVEYIYDLEAPKGFVPRPNDNEVEWFQLWDVEKIQEGLARGLFKPSYALVLLDFFIRHGVLDTNNEPDYVEISSRLHRVLELPTRSDRSRNI